MAAKTNEEVAKIITVLGKLNLSVRLKNKAGFWFPVVASIVLLWGSKLGVDVNTLHTFPSVFEFVSRAIQDPTILIATGTILWNALIDPTTPGMSDSETVLNGQTPKK